MASKTPLPPSCQSLANVIARAPPETWRAYVWRSALVLGELALRVVVGAAVLTWIVALTLRTLRDTNARVLAATMGLRDDAHRTQSVVGQLCHTARHEGPLPAHREYGARCVVSSWVLLMASALVLPARAAHAQNPRPDAALLQTSSTRATSCEGQ